jgi:hypothetical protein
MCEEEASNCCAACISHAGESGCLAQQVDGVEERVQLGDETQLHDSLQAVRRQGVKGRRAAGRGLGGAESHFSLNSSPNLCVFGWQTRVCVCAAGRTLLELGCGTLCRFQGHCIVIQGRSDMLQ